MRTEVRSLPKFGGEGGIMTSPCLSTVIPTPFDIHIPKLSSLIKWSEGARGKVDQRKAGETL